MRIEKTVYYQELKDMISQIIDEVEGFKTHPVAKLNQKPGKEAWSALECIEHLNLYGDFYLPEIQRGIEQQKIGSWSHFKTGFLGNRFTQQMKPGVNMKTMKTFKDKNPGLLNVNRDLGLETIEKFLNQQRLLLDLLEKSRTVNLRKTKTAISISTLIKLRLGDTFRFLIYHEWRHLEQAKRALTAQ